MLSTGILTLFRLCVPWFHLNRGMPVPACLPPPPSPPLNQAPAAEPALTPTPEEVAAVRWVTPEQLTSLLADADAGRASLSPWFRLIADHLLLPLWAKLADGSLNADKDGVVGAPLFFLFFFFFFSLFFFGPSWRAGHWARARTAWWAPTHLSFSHFFLCPGPFGKLGGPGLPPGGRTSSS